MWLTAGVPKHFRLCSLSPCSPAVLGGAPLTDVFKPLCEGGPEGEGEGEGQGRKRREFAFTSRELDAHFQIFPADRPLLTFGFHQMPSALTRSTPPSSLHTLPLPGGGVASSSCLGGEGSWLPYHLALSIFSYPSTVLLHSCQNRWCHVTHEPPVCAKVHLSPFWPTLDGVSL